jgi:superfamily II DNA helicase RecQ
VTEGGKKEALREAVLGGVPAARTMVFCNSAQAADDICALLQREGADATCYHRCHPMRERERAERERERRKREREKKEREREIERERGIERERERGREREREG